MHSTEDVFSSPLGSPKSTSYTLKPEDNVLLYSDLPSCTATQLVPDASPQFKDIVLEDVKEREVRSTPVQRPYIPLASHATPVQSSGLISSSNNLCSVTVSETSLSTPYVHGVDQYHFSSPMELTSMQQKQTQLSSSFIFSPPLTRSAVR